jgi:hypothetical protein
MRKFSFIFLALALLLSLLPVVAVSAPAQATKPVIAVFPIAPYVKTAPVIGGTVIDTDGQAIQYVHIQLTCLTNGTQWSGAAWLAPPQWLVTNAQDGAFDSSNEMWLYVASVPKYATGMQYEISVVKAEDITPEVQIVNPGIKFWYDTQPPAISVYSPPATADHLDEMSGSATDATSPVIGVKVQIRRGVDNKYLNMDANIWQDCEAWNDAAAEDGNFNEKSEGWVLDTSDVPWYDGYTYNIWAMTSDAAGNSVKSVGAKQYTCNKYSGTTPVLDIDMNGEEVPYFTNDADPDIRGSASSIVARFVARVMIKIERDDNHWWTGTAWEGGLPYSPQFVDAQPLDGNFNSNIEDWWNDSTTIDWSGPGVNNSYKITALVRDSAVTAEEDLDVEQFTIDLVDPATDVVAIPLAGSAPASITGSASDTAPGRVASVQVKVERTDDTHYWNGMAWQNNEVWLYSTVAVDMYPSYDWILNTYPIWEVTKTYNISSRAVDAAGNCKVTDSPRVFLCNAVPVVIPPTPTPTATPTQRVIVDAPAKVDKDGTFVATVRLNGVTDFDHATFRLSYTPAVIKVTGVSAGSKGTTSIPVTWTLVPTGTQGVVSVTSDVAGTTGLSGDMILALVNFEVDGAVGQKSDINFVAANSKLYDNSVPTAVEIAASWTKDNVEVQAAAASPTVTASPTLTASSTPSATPTPQVVIVAPANVDEGDSFSATVRLSGVKKFDNAQYLISYDPAVIQLTAVKNGSKGATVIPVTDWSLDPAGVQGKVSIVSDVPGKPGLDGVMTLAVIDFNVIGLTGTESDIDFTGVNQHCKLFDNGATAAEIKAAWVGDTVEVGVPTPSPTPTATTNATATPTATPTPAAGGGTPGWLWPLVGILIVLTLIFIGLALYKGGYLAKLGQMWGATEEDFLVDDMSDEDLYDAMYSGEEDEEL